MVQSNETKDLKKQIEALKDELTFFKNSTDRMSLALEAVKDGLWDYNIQKQEIYFSPRYYTMLGYEPYELPQCRETWVDLLHPEDRKKTVDYVDTCIKNNNNWSVEFRLRTKDGGYRWILGRGEVADRDHNGVALRRVGTHSDITESKQLELEREKLIEKLKTSLETVDTLSGMIPICSSCKKIRDDKGFWNQVETYIQSRSSASFTHSICPTCTEKLYGDADWFTKDLTK